MAAWPGWQRDEKLVSIYAGKIRRELKGAVDTRKVAEAWAALHPAAFKSLAAADPAEHAAAKAIPAALSAFLARFGQAIANALRSVLPDAWTEGWTLGQQSAKALAADLADVDWAGWSPGDVEAAMEVAGPGLRALLAAQDVTIKSIANSRLEELGDVLAEYLSSDVAIRPELPEPLPPQFSVGALADALEDVLDNPSRAEMVAQSEIARAQGSAAEWVFRQMSIAQVQVSTAADARVCPVCEAAEAAGPQPVGTYHLGLHPMCRCALIPVMPQGAGLAALGNLAGVS
jgi:SPP1 gp7 family putative phage head morphogenesis protein